jgi:hypothetical protein
MDQTELRNKTAKMRELMKALESRNTFHTDLGINLDEHIGDLRDEQKVGSKDMKTLRELKSFAEAEYLSDDFNTAYERIKIMQEEMPLAQWALERLAYQRDEHKGIMDVLLSRIGAHYDFLLRELLTSVGADVSKFEVDGKLQRDQVESFIDNNMKDSE